MLTALRAFWRSSPLYEFFRPVEATGCPGGAGCVCDRKAAR